MMDRLQRKIFSELFFCVILLFSGLVCHTPSSVTCLRDAENKTKMLRTIQILRGEAEKSNGTE